MLDSNVCLDLLVFGDRRAADLAAALHAGEITAVTDTRCRDEWVRVLDYFASDSPAMRAAIPPARRLDGPSRATALAAFDLMIERLPDAPPVPSGALPRCADGDDQKFLELALTSGARWLVTRDRALLVLDRRVSRTTGFRIVEPHAWPECPLLLAT